MIKRLKIQLNSTQDVQTITIQRFEEIFQLRHLEKLEFGNWKNEQWIRKHCERAERRGRIGKLALWLGKLHAAQIDQFQIPDVTIRWIGEKIGYGVFTNRSMRKWEFIGEYTGILKERKLFHRNINDYCFMYPRAMLSLKSFTIDSAQGGNFTRFINHRDQPNCESVSVFHDGIFHIIFRTIKEIEAGAELTYDYGDIYWSRRKKLPEPPFEELVAPEDLARILTHD